MSSVLIKNARVTSGEDYSDVAGLEGLKSNEDVKVLRLPNDVDLSQLELVLDRIDTLLVEFPSFADGRGFSIARQLRHRYNYTGLLIADGELIPDQYAFALQCGFDAVRVSEETYSIQTEADWHNSLKDFGLTYQRGYAIKNGPAMSVFDARTTALDVRKKDDPYFGYSAEVALRKAIEAYAGKIALVSSMGVDSAVLLHIASKVDKNVPVIFLDTEKHFRETLAYRDLLVERFGLTNFKNINPDTARLKAEDADGELHKSNPDACCNLRKVGPLDSVITGYEARITGRKRYQTPDRKDMPILELGGRQAKVNPLAYWSAKDVTNYIQHYDLPAHPMWSLGYTSIGCQPCTTRVGEGEDPRAGRWRNFDKDECGIHYIDGKWVQAPNKKSFEVF